MSSDEIRPPGRSTPGARFRELDGLRGIAAVLVVLSHLTYDYELTYGDAPRSPVSIEWGQYGVQLFFLISGFVILMSAQRAHRPSDFVISRFSRLYPVYWAALTWSIFLSVVFHANHTEIGWIHRLLNYTMFQRLMMVPNVDTVYWTLTIEMQFYILVFGLMVWTGNRLTNRVLRSTAGIWVGLSLLAAIPAAHWAHGTNPQFVWGPIKILLNLGLVQWSALFCAGMFAFRARFSQGKERSVHQGWAFALGLIGVLIHYLLNDLLVAGIVLVIVLGFLLVVFRERTGFLLWRPLQWFGKISYSLYIGHLIISQLTIHWLWPEIGRVPAMFVAFGVALLNAMWLHYLVEIRLSRWTKRKLVQWRDRHDQRMEQRKA